ncbi:MipA/OmpV family protein [Teredinibacter haidensis]|uniref:MipA/OmpV family protein n=1 Tax=Teredinibacter haidensis TaxID=2731755 RepID=UPI000948AFE4|nr:MipA/OmpV family protein [Teredinibacter haidensis]
MDLYWKRAIAVEKLCWITRAKCSIATVMRTAIIAGGLVAAPMVQAESDSCEKDGSDCVAVGEWEFSIALGAGLRSNPLIDGDDLPLFILPSVRYYGDRFFIDGYSAGYTFFNSGEHQVNAVVTIGFDQIYFKSRNLGELVLDSGPILGSTNDTFKADEYQLDGEDFILDEVPTPEPEPTVASPSINPKAPEWREPPDIDLLHSRDTAGLAGFEYAFYNAHWDASVQLLQDVSSVHDGQEVRAAIARSTRIAKASLELAAGFSWQSQELLQYYYGIEEGEVDDPILAYKTSSGISPFIRLDWRRRMSGNWSWQATVHQRWLASGIKRSPLLDEDTVLTLYFGAVYHF